MVHFGSSANESSLSNSQQALLKMELPALDLVGEVNHRMFMYVRRALMYLRTRGSPAVVVYISSPGGDVDSGLDIYDLLDLYPGEKTAVVNDVAGSMGAVILQACNIRQCAKHSHILIHHISRRSVTLDTLRDEKLLKDMIDEMEKLQDRQYKIFSEKTGKKVSEIREACEKDEHMTSEEALEFGLIDEILMST